MLTAVIFDCDGVLFDSHRANIEYFNSVLTGAGQARLDGDGERMATTLAGSQLMQILFGDNPALIERLRAVARDLDYTPFFQWMIPVPNLHNTLATLKSRYRLGMASNRGVTVPEVVRRFALDEYFEVALGVLDVPRPKPFPDMLEKCLQHIKVPACEAVYVGDAATDFAAADAAGMHFIGVSELTGAPHWVRHLDELPAALERVSSNLGIGDRRLSQS